MAVLALATQACGGGAPAPTGTPVPTPGDPAKLVRLDAGNFEALVLAAPHPALVEFQSPT